MKYDKPEILVIMFDETSILTHLSNGQLGGGPNDSDGDVIIDANGDLILQ